ncbi:MAG: DUF1801 domain-containing protein [Owenweeksia sp.]|nr:DUF1801 domain-containing protein [Owenweeksia sp.]
MMSQEALLTFYLNQPEPQRSCMLALRDVIMAFDPGVTAEWKYRLPFFYLHHKMFCYLWIDKNTRYPYVGFADGHKIVHPLLVQGNRKRMKVLPINPRRDIPLAALHEIMALARACRK